MSHIFKLQVLVVAVRWLLVNAKNQRERESALEGVVPQGAAGLRSGVHKLVSGDQQWERERECLECER